MSKSVQPKSCLAPKTRESFDFGEKVVVEVLFNSGS